MSSCQLSVSVDGVRLSIVTGFAEKHGTSRGNTEADGMNTRRDLVFWIAGAISDFGPGAIVLKPSIVQLNYRGEETRAVER